MKFIKGKDGKFAKKQFWDFETAKSFVLRLQLKGYDDWIKAIKEGRIPPEVPRRPDLQYRGLGWVDWGDFLQNKLKVEILPYHEAAMLVQKQNFKNVRGYLAFKKGKPFLPYKPMYYYADDWVDWDSFLKKPKPPIVHNPPRKLKNVLKTYNEAREFLRPLKIKDQADWYRHIRLRKIPNDIPTYPSLFYNSKDWGGWIEFLS
jgi:hypothetical protein